MRCSQLSSWGIVLVLAANVAGCDDPGNSEDGLGGDEGDEGSEGSEGEEGGEGFEGSTTGGEAGTSSTGTSAESTLGGSSYGAEETSGVGTSGASGEDPAGTSSGTTSGGGDEDGYGGADSAYDDGAIGEDEAGGETDDPIPPPEPGQLTAAEWRDLDQWPFWRSLFGQGSEWQSMETRWGFFTSSRVPVVVFADDLPVADAEVQLLGAEQELIWEARTDNLGRAELFGDLYHAGVPGPFTVVAASGEGRSESTGVQPADDGVPVRIDLETSSAPPERLDLMFVIDTTGSMGDELQYLQAELTDVIARVVAESDPSLQLRLSVNFYRDQGDEYIVRAFPFTTTVSEAVSQLGAQSSDGGGDYPEAVEVALENAIGEHEWSASARARLLFLVLDAPPHYTTERVLALHALAEEAARQGIRIIPLAASGLDKDTEFLLRFLGISTGATYTFLTDHSGIGGSHLEPTVGEYQVEQLNDLLVRLISSAVQ